MRLPRTTLPYYWWSAAHLRVSRKVHADTAPLGISDGVARDQIVVAAVDLDAGRLPAEGMRDAVSGDYVSAALDIDADLAVSNGAVASHLVAVGSLTPYHDSEMLVACQQVPLDQVVGGRVDRDAHVAVVPEGAVQDADVM